ncbi:site-specific integrase [Chryseobacterium sp. EO14]|uniref:site-specific integrase n=1 Tax=Chryseobacterium sp. EO14 TaxID=2950551 RepID=UPI00210CFD1D|nr:site-specific integrase [Chryseobacterium sp. EO14]MCQ4140630.1 site-specific integrase [Chryseobacterium sp. EO14]
MRSTFKVLFFLKRDKQKKDGTVPVYCRITIDGKEARFGMKKNIDPKLWNTKDGKATGKSAESSEINALLEKTKAGIHKIYREVQERENAVSAEKVKNIFLGIDSKQYMLLKAFDEHVEENFNLIGKRITKSTYNRYYYLRVRLSEFLTEKYHLSDIPLREINYQFIRDFEMYLLTVRENKQSTIAQYLINLKKILELAYKNEWIFKNPFMNYKIEDEKSERGYLTQAEVEILMNCKLDKRLERTRDVFIFCCFTGLSYIDVFKLTKQQIHLSIDGAQWIMGKREKTDVDYFIPMMEIPKKILEKYKTHIFKNGKLLPVKVSLTINRHLKEIAEICEIKKRLTFHLSRHTFATLAMSKGVSLESVSKMLGHKDIKTTQIYAKMTTEKVGRDMAIFAESMKETESKFVINY